DFALVDEVDTQRLQYLGLGKVANAGLRHHRDGHGSHDLFDELGISHTGNAAFGADHGGHALQSHDRDGASLFSDAGLLDVHDVHNDAALEHLGEAYFA